MVLETRGEGEGYGGIGHLHVPFYPHPHRCAIVSGTAHETTVGDLRRLRMTYCDQSRGTSHGDLYCLGPQTTVGVRMF